jgi:hypothetical protein
MALLPTDPAVYRRPSVISLLCVNFIPLVGVLFLKWDMFALISIYWLETAVIGFYTLVKLGTISGPGAFFLVPFFTVHMGGFMAGHWVFLSFFFGPGGPGSGAFDPIGNLFRALSLAEVRWMVLFLLVSHGVSFYFNFWRGKPSLQSLKDDRETGKKMLGGIIFEPYGRIVTMHIAIILGAMLSAILGSNRWMFALLVVLKTGADLMGHLKLHGGSTAGATRKPAPPPAPPPFVRS